MAHNVAAELCDADNSACVGGEGTNANGVRSASGGGYSGKSWGPRRV